MDEVVRLKAKVYENNVLDKYEAVGTISGESYYLSIDQVKLLASRNLVYGVKLDSKHNKLYGTKEDLRKLKRVNKKFARNIVKSMPNVLVGIELKSFVDRNIKDCNERYVVSDIVKFCTAHNNIDDHKICIVYGLRRTGKTIAMLHTINKLRDYSRSAYVSLNSDVSVPDLFQILNKLLENVQRKILIGIMQLRMGQDLTNTISRPIKNRVVIKTALFLYIKIKYREHPIRKNFIKDLRKVINKYTPIVTILHQNIHFDIS